MPHRGPKEASVVKKMLDDARLLARAKKRPEPEEGSPKAGH